MDILIGSNGICMDKVLLKNNTKTILLIELLLLAPGIVTLEEIVSWLYTIDDDVSLTVKKTIDIFIMKARRVIKPYNMEITTVFGHGYLIRNKPTIRIIK